MKSVVFAMALAASLTAANSAFADYSTTLPNGATFVFDGRVPYGYVGLPQPLGVDAQGSYNILTGQTQNIDSSVQPQPVPSPGNPSSLPQNPGWDPYGLKDASNQWENLGADNSSVNFNISGNSIAFIWGSPNNLDAGDLSDNNYVTFYSGPNGSGTALYTVYASDLLDFSAYATIDNSTDPGYLVGIVTPKAFESVQFGTGPSAFEFAFTNGVPEPSTWAMMGLGFAGLAFAGYRSRRTSIAAAL